MVMVPEAGYYPVPAARLTANTVLQFVQTISREIWPQRVLSGGPWGEKIGPVWNLAFICR
jgi:hypothetical protein